MPSLHLQGWGRLVMVVSLGAGSEGKRPQPEWKATRSDPCKDLQIYFEKDTYNKPKPLPKPYRKRTGSDALGLLRRRADRVDWTFPCLISHYFYVQVTTEAALLPPIPIPSSDLARRNKKVRHPDNPRHREDFLLPTGVPNPYPLAPLPRRLPRRYIRLVTRVESMPLQSTTGRVAHESHRSE